MTSYANNFTVSKVFSSNMVLQRDDVIRVWGFAPPEEDGKTVEANFMGLGGTAVIRDGRWTITLNGTLPASANPGQNLVVKGADGTSVTFADVLVGDVYMIIGQSNVRYPLEAIINGAPEGYPGRDCSVTDAENIRLNLSSIHDADSNDIYPVRGTTECCEDVRHSRVWQKPSEGALAFSALGYFTAKNIVAATGNSIPVGVIEFDGDGQALNAFMPNELANELHTDELTDEGIYKGMWHVDLEPSRYVYNHFIYPYQQCSICGIIWYQGESDFNDVNRPVFARNYTALINELRRRFDQKGDIPVYMVEIPSCYPPYEGLPAGEPWAYIDMGGIRSEQGRVPNMLDDCFIAASSDLWLDDRYWNSLHPYCKYPQAKRVSDLILARRYGLGDLEHAAAPQFSRVEYNGTRARVHYRYTAQGLTSAKTSDLLGFEVLCGGEWVLPDDVCALGTSVVLDAPSGIGGVRYNAVTTNYFPDRVNLCSGEGIPAIAFTDTLS